MERKWSNMARRRWPSTGQFSQGHLDNKAIQLIYDVTRVVLLFALTEIEKRFSHAARVKVKSLEKCWSQSMC